MTVLSDPARTPLDLTGGLRLDHELVAANRVRVSLRGALDLATAPLLAVAVAPHLVRNRRFVVLVMSELDFLDCSGLRVLLNLDQECRYRRGQLELADVQRQPRRLFALAGLDRTLMLVDSRPKH